MQKRKVIAIDGLSATGKSTLAKELAKKIGFVHLSTGALYRAVAYVTLKNNINHNNISEVLKELNKHTFNLILKDSSAVMIVDNEDVTSYLYTPKNSEMTSILSAVEEVRSFLIEPQRNAFSDQNIVIEGRDMGTVVFADADAKFFIKVNTETKIKRRIAQYCEGKKLTNEELENLKNDMRIEIVERDYRDEHRDVAPTIPAKDAFVIDNSKDGIENVLEKMMFFLRNKNVI